jgi:hypothetical protein
MSALLNAYLVAQLLRKNSGLTVSCTVAVLAQGIPLLHLLGTSLNEPEANARRTRALTLPAR